MRKHGGIIVFALLLLLVPVLANAWTLTVRVNGSSSAGEVTIAYLDSFGASQEKVIKAGTEYVQVPNGREAVVSVVTSPNIAADVYVDYVKRTTPYTIGGTTGNHLLSVNFTTAAEAKGSVNVVKTDGGTTLVQYNGTSSMTGFTNLTFGTQVGVKASPRTDYQVASIKVSKLAAGSAVPVVTYPTFTPAGVGQAVTVGVTVDQPVVEVSATYALVASATAVLSAPLQAVVGKPVTLSAAGSTSNTTVKYEFVVGGTAYPASDSPYLTFVPTAEGSLSVTLNVMAGSAVLATKTATINVVSEAVVLNTLCLGCHTGSTPEIITAYNEGRHGNTNIPCVSCHSEDVHNAPPSVVGGCIGCHTDKTPALLAAYDAGTHGGPLVDCEACHTNGHVLPLPAFAFSDCVGCHTERTPGILSAYDAGTHGGPRVACAACHDNGHVTPPPAFAFADCAGCHTEKTAGILAAYNAGTHGGPLVACNACHDNGHVTGPPAFTFADCVGCHTEKTPAILSAYDAGTHGGPLVACAACHDNGHVTGPPAFAFADCAGCHTVFTPELVSAWQGGGLAGTSCSSCHQGGPHLAAISVSGFDHGASSAHSSIATVGLSDCAVCHGATGHPAAAGASDGAACAICHTSPPVGHVAGVACLECHDPSSLAVDTGSAGNACITCHDDATPLLASEWAAGPHGAATGHTGGACQRCHTTEGAISGAAAGWTGSYADVLSVNTYAEVTATDGIDCAACHDPHSSTGLRAAKTLVGGVAVGWNPNQNGQSNDQFDLCTSCHTLYDNSGALTDMYHEKSSINITRMIADTHYDNPATAAVGATAKVEGYVIRANSANPCTDCHNVHTANLEVQKAWAASAHAGKIAGKKTAAIEEDTKTYYNVSDPYAVDPNDSKGRTYIDLYGRTAAGVATAKAAAVLDDHDGNAWTHYDWDNRVDCQRCHTATGAMNFLNDPAGYDKNANDFSHLAGWNTTSRTSPQNELLYCWGCHSDAQTGVLRNPGAITEVYAGSPSGSPTVTVVYPDLGKSNVCMACHLGRETGEVVKASTADFANASFINSHYLAAGATIFNESGYEYGSAGYAGVGYHKNVGVAGAFDTGTAGPCVTCHMSGAESHRFEVSAASPVCANCHGGLTEAILEASKQEFHTALAALETALTARGIYFWPVHPYFFNVQITEANAATAAISANAFKNWDGVYAGKGKDVMGAAFNFNLLEHDPGAYAHNRGYALKLIADSIDFLADGAVDGNGIPASVTAVVSSKVFAAATSHPAPVADPATADAVACGVCHAAAPHFGGNRTDTPQWVANGLSCADCHAAGDIYANQDILVGYAVSGHGDVAGVWTHDETGSSCQRCHTTRGYISNLSGQAVAWQPTDTLEVLTCNACHINVDPDDYYNRREPGAFTTTWSANDVTAAVTFPDAGDSNLCIRCHSGRRAGANITSTATTTAHYLPAAAVVFGGYSNLVTITASTGGGPAVGTRFVGGGYEFAGQNYRVFAQHKGIGFSDGGPCVNCHMAGDAGHSWQVLSRDASGQITAVNSSPLCVECHEDGQGNPTKTPAVLNASQAAFAAAVAALDTALQAKGIFFHTNGSFYTAPYIQGGTNTAVNYADVVTVYPYLNRKDLQGAAYNLWLFKYKGGDPAGWVHNRPYAMKLINDSIDYLFDGAFNGISQ